MLLRPFALTALALTTAACVNGIDDVHCAPAEPGCDGTRRQGECFSASGPAYVGKATSSPTSAGSIALSSDDALVYVADADRNVLTVVDAASSQKIADVPVGAAPARVLVGPDDLIYVSNRMGRSVSVIRRGSWSELDRIPVGIEPVGLALSADNAMLYVVNSASW